MRLSMRVSIGVRVIGAALSILLAGAASAASLSRDGWTLKHEVTNTDGLRVYDVRYADRLVLTSAKLAEWHADSGAAGYVLRTGSGESGGGFPVSPYGETAVLDLLGPGAAVIGFEVVQDFRMAAWGNSCNYRFEQRLQFYQDGSFRVVSGAYGKGCFPSEIYRPLMRIDIAVDGDADDSFARWTGSEWNPETIEGIWTQPVSTAPGGAAWRVMDLAGAAYDVVPGAGHFDDGGRGDDAIVYAVLHDPSEGDADLESSIGTCCNDDEGQGPDQYVDGDPIEDANLVLWYVPQMPVDSTLEDESGYSCWTIAGEPDPETYPCFAGPLFVPVPEPAAGWLGVTALLTLAGVGRFRRLRCV
jgi:hypothetical protein